MSSYCNMFILERFKTGKNRYRFAKSEILGFDEPDCLKNTVKDLIAIGRGRKLPADIEKDYSNIEAFTDIEKFKSEIYPKMVSNIEDTEIIKDFSEEGSIFSPECLELLAEMLIQKDSIFPEPYNLSGLPYYCEELYDLADRLREHKFDMDAKEAGYSFWVIGIWY
ncbi:MAG: hypothetical protein NC489_22220 [Ruminococcus flavefaciens]|nr:hypothetical protein [Ruminococcus flavefaciens]